jgi:hypothetical protein
VAAPACVALPRDGARAELQAAARRAADGERDGAGAADELRVKACVALLSDSARAELQAAARRAAGGEP